MIATKYIFRIAVAAAAFLIGHSAYAGASYALSFFGPGEAECNAAMEPAYEPLDLYPPDIDQGTTGRIFSGEFYLFDEALTKGFPDLDHLSIETTDDEGNYIAPRGAVYTRREHKFISISASGDHLAFETESIRGVSYRFNGTFGVDAQDYESGWALRGHFTKLQNGKSVGHMYVTFYPGGC
jgi:hypothetical protein